MISSELAKNLVNASEALRDSVLELQWVEVGTYHKRIEERDEAMGVLTRAIEAVKAELLMNKEGVE